MKSKKQIQVSGYCPTQNKNVTVCGNYLDDGFGEYALGTISCPYKELAKVCTEKPCPLRSKLPENI